MEAKCGSAHHHSLCHRSRLCLSKGQTVRYSQSAVKNSTRRRPNPFKSGEEARHSRSMPIYPNIHLPPRQTCRFRSLRSARSSSPVGACPQPNHVARNFGRSSRKKGTYQRKVSSRRARSMSARRTQVLRYLARGSTHRQVGCTFSFSFLCCGWRLDFCA